MKDLLNKMKILSENKNGKVITFDFDNTIIKSYEESNDGEETIYRYGGKNPEMISRIKKFKQSGATVLVVTSRNKALEVPESSVQVMLDKFKIQVDGVFYTNGEKKAQKLYELGSSLHYDDDPLEREAIEAYKKLHPSNIVVKNPDDFIKDTNEVSKGLILTNDGKIVIAQRSDSLEWDAPGGHIMQGEEANFSFYREILEELSLKVKKIDYLGSLNTTWQNKDKLVHYFIGRIPYDSHELEGVIQLQWEIEEYYCDDFDGIEKKLGEGATQNLKNAVEFFRQENLMLERAYPHSSNHSTKKRRLIGTGNNQETGATGLKKMKDFSRSKSAPADFGVLEEKDKKTSKKIKISIVSSIEEKKKRKKRKKSRKKRKSAGIGWPYTGFGGNISTDSGDGGGDGGGGE
jgi:8-oxo-dGTP pyrophosphatase MutT (NUDIX family)